MGKPTLYYALFSPPSRACIFTAKLIGLDMDLKPVNFAKREHWSPEFLKLNPQHQVPVFVDSDGEVYIDSHAIICFMVSKYAKDDQLYPKDLSKRARVDHCLHFENGVLFQVIKDMVARNIYGGEGELNPKTLDKCYDAYAAFETFLQNSDFVANSNHLTVADISMNTTLVSLHMLIPLDKQKYPKTHAWMERMKKLIPDYENTNINGSQELFTLIKTTMAENKSKTKALELANES